MYPLSEIRVNTLSDAAGTGPAALTAQAAAKARYEYNQATPAIGESQNVSSITDNAAGDYDPAWTNAFDTATYQMTAAGNFIGGLVVGLDATAAKAAGSINGVGTYVNGGSRSDTLSSAAFFGDLA